MTSAPCWIRCVGDYPLWEAFRPELECLTEYAVG